jgi:hypothetical protein
MPPPTDWKKDRKDYYLLVITINIELVFIGKFPDATNYGFFEAQFGQSIRSTKSSKKRRGQ